MGLGGAPLTVWGARCPVVARCKPNADPYFHLLPSLIKESTPQIFLTKAGTKVTFFIKSKWQQSKSKRGGISFYLLWLLQCLFIPFSIVATPYFLTSFIFYVKHTIYFPISLLWYTPVCKKLLPVLLFKSSELIKDKNLKIRKLSNWGIFLINKI